MKSIFNNNYYNYYFVIKDYFLNHTSIGISVYSRHLSIETILVSRSVADLTNIPKTPVMFNE
jgi:hypothetical protein